MVVWAPEVLPFFALDVYSDLRILTSRDGLLEATVEISDIFKK